MVNSRPGIKGCTNGGNRTICCMKQKKRYPTAIRLTDREIEALLLELGKNLKTLRQKRTTIERLSIELDVSKSQIIKYESGSNMRLSNLFKILYGLQSNCYEFFEGINK